MIGPIVAASLLLLLGPAAIRPWGSRMDPLRWARLVRLSLFTGATGIFVSLFSLGLPEVLRAFGVERLARLCDRLLGHVPHVGPLPGWVALAGAAWMAVVALRSTTSTARVVRDLRVERHLGRHHDLDGYDLAVLPTETHLAYSLAGRPGQVVVSRGTVAALSELELDTVVLHEKAHLDCDHGRVLRRLAVVRRIYAWIPGVSAAIAAARAAIEREADERATAGDRGRRDALARALTLLAAGGVPEAVPGFSGCDAVEERVASMNGDLPPLRPVQERIVAGALRLLSLGSLPVLVMPGLFLVGVCAG